MELSLVQWSVDDGGNQPTVLYTTRTIQWSRGADWAELGSGGDKVDLALYFKPWINPQELIKLGGSQPQLKLLMAGHVGSHKQMQPLNLKLSLRMFDQWHRDHDQSEVYNCGKLPHHVVRALVWRAF